ncbi:alkaline shock protein [Paucilactobacillus hokkaidonensis JCM 18461]|uniref:Transcription antitermination protein NusB n=2 Tax=Paucilactobacillus hokkaidonensis TaxID=1193095 RepID=A0A0A1GX88_9LACO|nr:transcription antitermination factor NusB [Paucilactobacillus hokkaidonensis]KRO09781.1 transcription antitermination protein NusB [Paucilactobacillus hokkaidonensis]BAP85553.1 alkaline shock protein [Paucilactobacillus hokkaidonensis JCM 18461]
MTLNRHRIRESAFQILFALESNPSGDINAVYEEVLTGSTDNNEIPVYLKLLVDGVVEHQEQLDQQITGLLAAKWRLSRLAKTDLVILRIALFELQYVDDVPAAVVINEALELTKTFSDEASRRFVNGILGNFEKTLS